MCDLPNGNTAPSRRVDSFKLAPFSFLSQTELPDTHISWFSELQYNSPGGPRD